jgi:hypothetical protein
MDYCNVCECELVTNAEMSYGICDECVMESGEDLEHDGQPDEAQEWHDFDPDC